MPVSLILGLEPVLDLTSIVLRRSRRPAYSSHLGRGGPASSGQRGRFGGNVKGCDRAARTSGGLPLSVSSRTRRASRGLPGMDIVRNATRRPETLPAQCHARHAPLSALLPRVLGRLSDSVTVSVTATDTDTATATVPDTDTVPVSATGAAHVAAVRPPAPGDSDTGGSRRRSR